MRGIDEIRSLLDSADPGQRLEAALDCYDIPCPELLPALLEALERETNLHVRASLVKAVGAVQEPACINVLLEFLRDPDSRVRANTIEALGNFRDASLVPHFERMVSDPHPRVSGNAMLALAHFDELRFRDALDELARSTLPSECCTALYVMSKLEKMWSLRLLGKMALRPDNPVKAQTEKLLQQMARWQIPGAGAVFQIVRTRLDPNSPENSLTVLQPPKITTRNLAAHLAAGSREVRIFAIQEAAQRLQRSKVIPLFVDLLEKEENLHVIATLTKWLGIIGDEDILKVLSPFFSHGDARVRANTLEGLIGHDWPGVKKAAARMTDDPSPRVRAIAGRIVMRFDARRGLETIRRLLLSDSLDDVESVVPILDNLECNQVIELIEIALLEGAAPDKLLAVLERIESRIPLARTIRLKFTSGGFIATEGGYIRAQMARLENGTAAQRHEALWQLRFSRSPSVWNRIEKASVGDESPRVRKLAALLLDGYKTEKKRRVHFYSMGLRVLQLYENGRIRAPDLLALCERVTLIDKAIEEDDCAVDPIERLVMERRDNLVIMGERAYNLCREKSLSDDVLEKMAAETDKQSADTRR